MIIIIDCVLPSHQASGFDLLTSLRVDTRPCIQPEIRAMGQVPIHGGGFGTFAAIKTGLSFSSRKEKGIIFKYK